MAEKYPSLSLPEQATASRHQSEPLEHQHGQVVGHNYPDLGQDQIKDQGSALPCSQQTGIQQISQADICLITHKAKLRKAELDYLFEELEISAADIDNGRRIADTTDFKLQSSSILRAWVQKKAKDATRNVIIEALRECDLTDAAEFLENIFSESVISDMSTESSATFDLHRCQEELREYFLEDVGKVNMLPWIPEENKEMESIYVDLELVWKEESKASQTIKSNEDLVTLTTNQGQSVNRVLVTGDAGSGKSTTAGNIAYKWALNNTRSPLSQFALVFLIRMKDIEDSKSSLVDIIFDNILTEDSNVSKEGLSKYVKENAKAILFIIDGMDEDSSGALKDKSSEITKLLHRRKLPTSCVILTSRPKNISDLGTYVRHYTQVKLEGFSVNGMLKYIVKFFRDDNEIVDLLFRKLVAEPHIHALASIPVLLLMICMLWEDQRTTPKTKTQLYQNTMKYLWRRYKIRIGGDPTLDEDFDNDEFDEELKYLLNKLGEVALHTINIDFDRPTFTEKEFGKDVCNLGCQVGILRREQSRAGLGRKTSVAFLHATFRYFCAAFRLAYLLDTKQNTLEDFDGKLFLLLSEDQFIYKFHLLEFCCGIRPLVTTTFLQQHTRCVSQVASETKQSVIVDISTHLSHIFEGQLSYDQCSNLIPMLSGHGTELEVTDDLIPSVIYILELYKSSATQTGVLSSVKKLVFNSECTHWLPTLLKHTNNLHECTIDLLGSENVGTLDKMYKALSNIKELSLLNLGALTPIYHGFDATNLLNSLTEKRMKLTVFRLLGFQFDEKVMVRYLSSTSTSMLKLELSGSFDGHCQLSTISNVIDILPRLEDLKNLDLCRFQIGSAVKHLRPIISQLEVLALKSCRLQENHLNKLFYFLNRAQQLKSIDLSDNFLSVEAIHALVESLKTIPGLEQLTLSDTGLNDESACILARFVREKSSINFLALDDNPGIGHVGKDALRGLPLKRWVFSSMYGGDYENIEAY